MLSQEVIDAKLNQWTGLVYKVVLKHFNKHHTQYKEHDELINIGLFGLYNGIITYDKDKGASEMSYYYKCIYNEILKIQNYHMNDRRNTKGRNVSLDAYKDANGESSLDSQEWFTSPSQSDGLALESGLREVIDTLDETNKQSFGSIIAMGKRLYRKTMIEICRKDCLLF